MVLFFMHFYLIHYKSHKKARLISIKKLKTENTESGNHTGSSQASISRVTSVPILLDTNAYLCACDVERTAAGGAETTVDCI